MRASALIALTLAIACNPVQRLQPFADEPNVPADPGQSLPNTPTEPTIDTDVIVIDSDTDAPIATPGVLTLDAGTDFTCAVYADGELRCWGSNLDGRSEAPTGSYIDVGVGTDHACAVAEDGSAVCWGNSAEGKTTAPAGTYRRIAAGANGTCAIRDDSSVTCWGTGLTPPADLTIVDQVAVGDGFACAILDAGQGIRCWGAGDAVSQAPVGETWIRIAAGTAHACAVQADREVVCWGTNNAGQTNAPAQVDAVDVAAEGNQSCLVSDQGELTCWGAAPGVPEGSYEAVAPGADHVCVLRQDRIECTGDNTAFQLQVPIRSGLAQVSVSTGGHLCTLATTGEVSCFGNNSQGQATPPEGTFAEISAGFTHTCARSGGTVTCWGGNTFNETVPKTDAGQTYVQVEAGRFQTCGRTTEGPVECWGKNYDTYPAVPGANTDVANGDFHACALANGVLTCWGINNFGQRNTPEGYTWTGVWCGYDNTCAIDTSSNAVCWGGDAAGKSTAPAGTFSEIAVGFDNTCGLTTSGLVTCWGDNTKRQNNAPAVTFSTINLGNGLSCGITTEGGLRCWGDRTL